LIRQFLQSSLKFEPLNQHRSERKSSIAVCATQDVIYRDFEGVFMVHVSGLGPADFAAKSPVIVILNVQAPR